jgi:serine/threonine protein kinase
MTMELLEGESLEALLNRQQGKPLPLNQAFTIIQDIGAALGYAHQQGVVHSDIKPANLFITRTGRVKVLDFGIATAMYQSAEDASATVFNPRHLGALTTAYAPVEMFAATTPDPRDDIYAFAVVCYEILAGHHPFDKQSTLESLRQGLEPKPVGQLNKPQWKALKAGLAYRRENRTPSVEQFLQGLLTERPPRSNKQITAIAATAVILIVAAGFGLFGTRTSPGNKPAPQQTQAKTNQTDQTISPVQPEATPAPIEAKLPASTISTQTDPSSTPAPAQPAPTPEPKPILALTTAHPQYHAGDKFWFYAAVTDDSYLTCYYDDSSDTVRIFPNRFQNKAYIAQGQRLEIPDMSTQDGFDITLDNDSVTEKILCLATTEDIHGRLPVKIWGKDLTPLPIGSMKEIIDAFVEIAPNSAVETLEIPVAPASPLRQKKR